MVGPFDGRLAAVALLLVCTGLGYFLQFGRLRAAVSDSNSVVGFLNKFREWVSTKPPREDLYQELVMESAAIQGLVNASGESYTYVAPFQRFSVNNFQAVTTLIPDIARDLRSDSFVGPNVQHIQLVDDTLLRLIGHARAIGERIQKELRNPLVQFREGVRSLVRLPYQLLEVLGLHLPGRRVIRASFTVLGSIVAILGFVSSIVTIAIGWDQFAAMVEGLLSHRDGVL